MYTVTSLIQKMLALWTHPGYEPGRRILVSGKYVTLTPSQARRYEELRQARRTGR